MSVATHREDLVATNTGVGGGGDRISISVSKIRRDRNLISFSGCRFIEIEISSSPLVEKEL